MKTKTFLSHFGTLFLLSLAVNTTFVVSGCGDNLFSSLAKRDNKDKGKSAFQSGDYNAAISYLNDYLAANPNDTEARSMLATAYMKKVGLDELSIASSISNSSSGGDWSSIVSLMPGGTADNVASLKAARDVISAIPSESRTPEQNYQLAIASAALAVTVVKETLCDASGTYTPTDEKIAAISTEDANLILESMTLTASAATATGSTNTGLSKLADVNTQIDAMDGSDNLTKVQNFLASKR
jgi:hypothetical protein